MKPITHDRIGKWTEVKEEIIRSYAQEYSKIMNNQNIIRGYAFIDGFAGSGLHESRDTGKIVLGSPQVALSISPQFSHYYFIDLKKDRTEFLNKLRSDRKDITVINDDCNDALPRIFNEWKFTNYKRALCILDPYNLNPNWNVITAARSASGPSGGIDLFINFMIMDANRNVFRKNHQKVDEKESQRMDDFWGDNSWNEVVYIKNPSLFDELDLREKQSNNAIVVAYRKRLMDIGGYKFVSEPFPMLNSTNAVIYYLIFATMNKTAFTIVSHILSKYKKLGIKYGD